LNRALSTHVLVYALNTDAPQYSTALAMLDGARDPSVRLYVTAPILCESYSITGDFKVFPELAVVSP
jgi:predicted nucleic acid-binding protein